MTTDEIKPENNYQPDSANPNYQKPSEVPRRRKNAIVMQAIRDVIRRTSGPPRLAGMPVVDEYNCSGEATLNQKELDGLMTFLGERPNLDESLLDKLKDSISK